MNRAVRSAIFLLVMAGWCGSFSGSQDSSPPNPQANAVVVAAGESLVLELQDSINTRNNRKGDHVHFKTSNEVLAGGRVAIPRGSLVRATITKSKRARPLGGAEVELSFDEVQLADGTSLPLSADLSRAGWWQSNGKIKQTAKGELGRGRTAMTIGQHAAMGAILGGALGGRGGLVRGAAAGGAIGAIGILLQHGPELDLPPGMMFEIDLVKPLSVPIASIERAEVSAQPEAKAAIPPQQAGVAPPVSHPSPTPSTTVAANRTPPPAPAVPAPTEPAPATRAPGGFTLKVDVNLVLVEATVRDGRGALVDNLKRENFRLFEDGTEQEIRYFSRDELPLAIALVVDRSGSMAPVLRELREAAYETLSLLKPDDQVALFAFAAQPERLEYLTPDRQRIAERIADIRAGGGTNITDALFEAALYLGRAAPNRRHAIILVSDNQGTVRGYAGDREVIRTALETETVLYSIKISSHTSPGVLNFPLSLPGTGSVKKMANETGGEIIEAGPAGSVSTAMAAVVSRLKQRYTLGYQTNNHQRNGAFRAIEVHLADDPQTPGRKYTVYARRGYYAPGSPSASRNNPQ